MAGWKNPRRGVYRRVRLHFAQSSSGHRSKCCMRFLLGPCGALCAQIWPLGGQNRARGTFASLRTDGEISEVSRNTPFFHQLLGRNKHFPVFPSMIRACYGRCESLTTFIPMSSCRERGLAPNRWVFGTAPCSINKTIFMALHKISRMILFLPGLFLVYL